MMRRVGESARGSALITALLIVAAVVVVAAGMASGQHVELRRTANLLDRERAVQLALGGEGWAIGILSRDGRAGSHDHLQEEWALSPPPVPVRGGVATGGIVDLQGRFNLNNLLVDGKPDPVEMARFTRLLHLLHLDPGLAWAVVDWMDPDQVSGGIGGAEDATYLGRNPPY
ncbi:MAG: type II secretion system minor pseudopilin GspK, partial [Magnetococcales bacterium]|nr:type II secretion system minor pseudopilin GspK [Magnetococcales bacterium]